MKISIITATLNRATELNETIKSVMEQAHTDIDYIIIDGGSTDNSIEIIEHWKQLYPNNIRYISQTDNGIYEAINKGIKIATGDVIGTLHAGDRFYSPNVLSIIDHRMSDPQINMIYGDVHYVNNSGRIVRKYSSKNFKPELLKIGIAPPHPSLFLRKSIFEKYGLYKENYLIGADFELFVRLMLVNNLPGHYLPLDMVEMSTGGLSTQLFHRIFTNNKEKYRALRENSINVCCFSLLKRYLYTLK